MSTLPTVTEDVRQPAHVYVVHHDGGRAPVTVYTADGTEVVELPPRYGEGDSAPPAAAGPAESPSRALPEAPAGQSRRRSGTFSSKLALVRRVVN